MRKSIAGVLALVLSMALAPAWLVGLELGTVSGVARDAQGNPLAIYVARLRNIQTGELAAQGATNAVGEYQLANIAEGTYVVEIVDSAGNLVGTSTSFALAPGAAVTDVVVTAFLAAAAAAGVGAFFGTPTGLAALASMIGGGTAWAFFAARDEASPSR